MKKTTALWTLAVLVSFSSGAIAGGPAHRSGQAVELLPVSQMQAPPQAAKAPAWKSRDEYDAFNAMASQKDPQKKIALAEAFIQKYPTSDFKDSAYLIEMQTYQQLGQTDKAVEAAKKAVEINPDNLPGLRYLCFTFPFLYKESDPNAQANLSAADANAHHGLDALSKLQKPANATDAQFQQAVKDFRSVFNSCIGFVALQKKDYPSAITALKAATDDNPSSVYAPYWLGLAYHYSTPKDEDLAIWYYARAVALGKAAKDPNADAWEKYLKDTYIAYHGTDTGLTDIEAQAATSPNPPDGFKVAQVQPPKPTGNQLIDTYNTLTFPLSLGGETAQKQWDAIKGQPIEMGGTITSIDKGADPGTYLIHLAILDSTKAAGNYDIELKDSTQPKVKNLIKGDLLTFKGTLDSYSATPTLTLTVVGEVTSELPDTPETTPKTTAPKRAR